MGLEFGGARETDMKTALLALVVLAGSQGQVYDERADARVEIRRMLDCAREEGKPLLLTFGANWCEWCQDLHTLLSADRELASLLDDNYLTLSVDVGDLDRNIALAAEYGVRDLDDTGIPVLVVLRAAGDVAVVKNADDFVKGERYSRSRVRDFLRKYRDAVLTVR